MADRSAIEWTDASWNPIRARAITLQSDGSGKDRTGWHCEHVSEGCRNCYAEAFNRRLGTTFGYKPGNLKHRTRLGDRRGEVTLFLDETMLLAPLRWRRPRKIFVGSMTDIFADFVPDEWLDRMFAVMALCPHHVFQLLTKRPERMRRYHERFERADWLGNLLDIMDELARGCGVSFGSSGFTRWPLPNVWLGTSIEDRPALLDRAGHLRKTPAAVRFFSCEPLLGDLGDVVLSDIDWIICGGESGADARPMHPDWARSLRDQCAAAGVPFFFKQWGEYRPCTESELKQACGATLVGDGLTGAYMMRVGKKKAGRLLDGVEHNGMPA
ncbi:MAG TPA: phage Gp37/Gp68 family protein [Allosphingosinicella sp.]|jgi:protein gp37